MSEQVIIASLFCFMLSFYFSAITSNFQTAHFFCCDCVSAAVFGRGALR